ncbi:hypothetical protein AAVH_21840 [Aphelenchoides avenae]|nr:hypothetical protein AAVH_21840 [Aphelenchus avenae]
MTKNLTQQGIRLTAWVHPFVNVNSTNGKNQSLHELFVSTVSGKPEPVKWWNGHGYVVDFTNPKAAAWFESELTKLQKEGGIFTYKFDSGEINYMPKNFRLHSGKEPNDFTTSYVGLAAKFGSAVENRIASRTQNLTIFLRTLDRSTTWEGHGLRSLIPEALTYSIHGYYWNLPDMIGGNGPGRPDSELFIRWIQVNTFLVARQFSIAPWEVGDEVVAACRKMFALRDKFADYVWKAMSEAVQQQVPVIRPLWWHMDSPEAYTCSDQFFFGDDLLVAPVVYPGETKRTVHIPPGKWVDQHDVAHDGPAQIEVEAALDELPYFVRQR